jgi:hypothetical protein
MAKAEKKIMIALIQNRRILVLHLEGGVKGSTMEELMHTAKSQWVQLILNLQVNVGVATDEELQSTLIHVVEITEDEERPDLDDEERPEVDGVTGEDVTGIITLLSRGQFQHNQHL